MQRRPPPCLRFMLLPNPGWVSVCALPALVSPGLCFRQLSQPTSLMTLLSGLRMLRWSATFTRLLDSRLGSVSLGVVLSGPFHSAPDDMQISRHDVLTGHHMIPHDEQHRSRSIRIYPCRRRNALVARQCITRIPRWRHHAARRPACRARLYPRPAGSARQSCGSRSSAQTHAPW